MKTAMAKILLVKPEKEKEQETDITKRSLPHPQIVTDLQVQPQEIRRIEVKP